MSTPKVTKLDKESLNNLTSKDFFPDRLTKEENTTERVSLIATECSKLFGHSKDKLPTKEEYPILYHELPTLWALIEEGKFRYWSVKEQMMLSKMIELKLNATNHLMTDEDAEKQAGLVLADRFLYPVTGSPGSSNKDDDSKNIRD
jgi:hypothetical protein